MEGGTKRTHSLSVRKFLFEGGRGKRTDIAVQGSERASPSCVLTPRCLKRGQNQKKKKERGGADKV